MRGTCPAGSGGRNVTAATFSPCMSTLPAFLEKLWADPVERFHLPNGLLVLLQPQPVPGVVSAQLWLRTGSLHEGAFAGGGLSHYLEHVVFKGTAKRTAAGINAEAQARGGALNAYTSFDRTVYHLDVPAEEAAFALDLLGDLAFAARLPEEEVERERGVILREIDMGLDDPDRRVSQALFATAFREHPCRHPVIGRRALFEQVRPADLRAYYTGRYTPANAVLVVAGDFEVPALRALAGEHFGALADRPLMPAVVAAEPRQLAPREERMEAPLNLARGAIAFKIPGLRHDDAPGLDLLASVLGGGQSAVLWQRLREEARLVHHIDCAAWNPGETGLLWISYLCDPGKLPAVEEQIASELARLVADPGAIAQEEADRAFRQFCVAEVNARKTSAGQAARLGLAEVVVGDLGFPRRFLRKAAGVKAVDLAALLDRYAVEEGRSTVSLAPPAKASSVRPRAVAALAPFEERTLANGARLLVQRDERLPKMHLRVALRGGPLYEEPGRRGLSALFATLLCRDTQKRTAAEVAAAVESAGASFGEYAGNNSLGWSLEVLEGDRDLAHDLLREALLHPVFAERTFEVEREGQIAQLEEDMDDIVSFGRKHLRRRFFGAHPFAVDVYGEREDLAGLTVEDARAQYEKLLRAGNVVVAASGMVGDEDVQKLEALLLDLPDTPFTPVEQTARGPVESGRAFEALEREQAIVFEAFADCGVRSEDYTAGEFFREHFSDMAGRLFARVREEKALAYFVGATRITGLDDGLFALYGGTEPVAVEEVFGEMEAEVERLRGGGLEAEERTRVCTRLKAARRMGLQQPGHRAVQAALNALYGLPVNDWRDYDARVDALTPECLTAYARRYLDPQKRLRLVVGRTPA